MTDEGTQAPDGATADAGRQLLATRRERRFMIGVGLALLIPLAIGVVVGIFVLPDQDAPSSARDLLILVALVLGPIVVGFGVVVGIFVLGRRRKVWWLQTSPAWALSWRDRRRIVKSVRAGQPLHGYDRTVARDTARRMLLQRWIQPVLAALWAINLVFALLSGSLWRTVCWSALLVLMAAVLPIVWRDARRARRYLDANLDQDR